MHSIIGRPSIFRSVSAEKILNMTHFLIASKLLSADFYFFNDVNKSLKKTYAKSGKL